MSSTSAATAGSAERWGPLWGARPTDWALNEEQQTPTYEEALRRVDVWASNRLAAFRHAMINSSPVIAAINRTAGRTRPTDHS